MASVSDNFNRANENPLASPWIAVENSLKIDTNIVYGVTGSVRNVMRYGGAGLSGNHEAQLKLGGAPASVGEWYRGPCVRCQSGAVSYYAVWADAAQSKIIQVIAGTLTDVIAGGPAGADQDVLRLRAVTVTGVTTLTLYINDVLKLTHVATTELSGGDPGMLKHHNDGTTVDDFLAADVVVEEEEEVWLPYLAAVPSGRTGRIDPLTKRTDVGQMTFRVQDHALTPGPAHQDARWLSSFFGDVFGRSKWLGLKAVCDESMDGGETWVPYWTGRIQSVKAAGKLQFDFLVNDMSEDLKALVGVGLPHPAVQGYAGVFSLLPLGPQAPYGLLSTPTPLGAYDRAPILGTGRLVSIFTENRDIPTNVVTEELLAGSTPGAKNVFFDLTNYHFVPNDDSALRVRIRHLTGAHAGAVGVYRVGYLITAQRPNGTAYVTDFEIHSLAATAAPGYLALPASVSLQILSTWQDAGISETQPLLINDQVPAQHIDDIAHGYYGWLFKPGETVPPGASFGDPKRSVPVSSASLAAVLGDPSWPTARLWLDAVEPGGDVIENLCQDYQLGIFLDGAGELNLVDLRIPTVTPDLELTDADVVAAANFEWSLDRDKSVQRVNASYYYDYLVPPADLLSRGETLPSIAKAIVYPIKSVLEVLEVGPSDLGDTALDIDGRGYRYMDGEVVENRARVDYEKAQLAASARCLTYPFGSGSVTCSLTFRRTSNALQVQPGTLLKLTVSWLPDPWTNQRGGTRVVRCTDLTRLGATITARFLDYGSGSVAGVPSIGTPAQMPGNGSHGAHAVFTSNAQGDTIDVEVAVTNGGSAPAANDPAWHLWAVLGFRTTPPWTYDLYAYGLPAGGRVWFRARSRPGAYNRLQQASAWIVSSSVDLVGLSAPSGLGTSAIGSTVFTFSFTPGDTALRTEVLLAQPSTSPYLVVTTLPPGTTTYTVTGLDAGTVVGLKIRHTDGAGGYSSEVGTTVTMLTAGSDTDLPAVDGFALTLYTP
jgi:hypothetical protein